MTRNGHDLVPRARELREQGLAYKQVGQQLGVSESTVHRWVTADTTPTERRLARYAEAVRLVDEGKARPQVVEVVELIRQGLNGVQAAERLGIAKATVFQRLSDPTDEENKARKRRHSGECVDCGAATYGGNGRANAPKRCLSCERAKNDERTKRIVELWEQGLTGPQIGERLGLSATVVTSCINDCRRKRGMTVSLHRRRNREAWPTIERMWNEGCTLVEIASELDTTANNVAFMVSAMRRAGIDLHQRTPRWRAKRARETRRAAA